MWTRRVRGPSISAMPLDAEALLRDAIPEVGLGQDPLDARRLDFVAPRRGPRALPFMAVVLGRDVLVASHGRAVFKPEARPA